MKCIINSLDNDKFYSSASVYAEVDDVVNAISNEELAEMLISKPPLEKTMKKETRSSFNSEDYYGPQRWNIEGDKLSLSSEEGIYNDSFGNSFIDLMLAEERGIDTDKYDAYIAWADDPKLRVEKPKTVKHTYESWFATESGQEFLRDFHEDAEDDLKELSVYSQSDMTHESYIEEMTGKEDSDESSVWDVAQKVDGGVTKEEISFLGMNMPSERVCTFAWGLNHNPKWLLRRCKEMSVSNPVWLTQELKEWMWELLKSALDETWKEELKKGKTVKVEIYPPTEKLKEGFINLWCYQDGNILSTKRIFFFKDEEERALVQLSHIEATSREKGFLVRKSIKNPLKDSYKDGRNAFITK